ncbi:coiled-coil domain-containing protein 130 homolog [Rhopilema esculentum]|uniref:coiled-coil domain-containing protein 130 homolog n=1 Tax=Rhopilema esculentum TaxID=499914 RepID=UPI0031E0A53F
MGERKGTNKYYPPDFDPRKGSLNAYHGTHALRERARKIHEGIIIIRFEMPYNIWCNGCGNHIGMGVRYNAQKRKVGNYYTTPIYKFRMKCHLCDQHFEIQTDPKNCEYVILSGAKRKEERWDPAVTENIQTTDRDVKAKLVSDAMFKLEHTIEDKQKAKRSAPTLGKIREIRDVWEDDFAVNQALRKKFREEKKEINKQKSLDDEFKERNLLPSSVDLAEENEEDSRLAKRIRYGEDLRPDIRSKIRKKDIKESSIFESEVDSKGKLARRLAGLAKKKQVNMVKNSVFSGQPSLTTVRVGRKMDGKKGASLTENNSYAAVEKVSNKEITVNSFSSAHFNPDSFSKSSSVIDSDNAIDKNNSLQTSECQTHNSEGKVDCNNVSVKTSLVMGYDSSSDSNEIEDDV